VLYLSFVVILALLGVIGCYPILILFSLIGLITRMFPATLVLLVMGLGLIWVFINYRR
jgi:hypothetical protein